MTIADWTPDPAAGFQPPAGVAPHTHSGSDITSSIPASSGGLPVGAITMWMLSTPPADWLILDGSSFSAVTYPALASHLGGTTLPNLKGKGPMAYDAAQTEFNTLGGSGGSKTSTAPHTHDVGAHTHQHDHAHNITDPGHSHGVTDSQHRHGVNGQPSTNNSIAHSNAAAVNGLVGSPAEKVTFTSLDLASANLSVNSGSAGITATASTASPANTTGPQGSTSSGASSAGATSGNLQPYFVLNFIIKAA